MNHDFQTRQNSKRGLPRRAFLQGVGVTMALPWLESLSGLEGVSAASQPEAATAFPKRFAVMFMGNGISPDHWWMRGAGADIQFSKTLEPLDPVKSKVNVIHGLFNRSATGQGIHPPMTGNLLSGVPIQRGAIIHGGISMDQMLANHIGQDTPQAIAVIACSRSSRRMLVNSSSVSSDGRWKRFVLRTWRTSGTSGSNGMRIAPMPLSERAPQRGPW